MSLERVYVVGAGLMGHGIAQVCAAAGKSVTLADRTDDLAAKGRQRIESNLARQVEKGRLDQAAVDETMARIATAVGVEGAGGHDLVIEAVFEDEALKRETWTAVTDVADAGAIFASNTSSISITSLATATDRPDRFIGLHFFSPVPVMGLIEIIRGLDTSDATEHACRAFAQELGKTVITSKDYPGFLVNRMLGPFINEAIFALDGGHRDGRSDRHRRAAGPESSDGTAGAERLHRERRDAQRDGRPAPRLWRPQVPCRATPSSDGGRRSPGPEDRPWLLPIRRSGP